MKRICISDMPLGENNDICKFGKKKSMKSDFETKYDPRKFCNFFILFHVPEIISIKLWRVGNFQSNSGCLFSFYFYCFNLYLQI